MQTIKCDSKGRVYLKESLRRRYGSKYIAVPVRGRIILYPIPKDPVADLREVGKKLRGKSMRELKAAIDRAAREEVVG